MPHIFFAVRHVWNSLTQGFVPILVRHTVRSSLEQLEHELTDLYSGRIPDDIEIVYLDITNKTMIVRAARPGWPVLGPSAGDMLEVERNRREALALTQEVRT